MQHNDLMGGTIHPMPKDLQIALAKDPAIVDKWQSLTPLARNEWICWVISVKHQKTRDQHIVKAILQLRNGKRRPCCWMGCIHRPDKPLSPSVKGILKKAEQ